MDEESIRLIRLALPSKGRLEGETLSFLDECNLKVKKPNPRQYSARIPAMPDIEVVFQRPRDIPRSLAAGDIDLGITGYDSLHDALAPNSDFEKVIIVHDALGFGECALAVAVPNEWHDVDDLDGLRKVAARHGSLRVATRHENATRRFFEENQLHNIQIISADGALEAAPAIGYADFIADITSTGTTLRENNLKPLIDGVILQSEAILVGNRNALATRPEVRDQTLFLLEFVEAHLNARNQYMLAVNMRGRSAEDIAEQLLGQTNLMGLQGPTIAPLITNTESQRWWALSLVVSSDQLYDAVQQLRKIGGSGVVVTPATYIFEEQPERAKQLLQAIEKGAAAI